MKHFWLFTYNIFSLPLFWIFIHIAAIFNPKIRTGLRRRRFLFSKLKSDLSGLDSHKKNLLIQCSSLGEFQEAKPIMEELDKSNSYNFIVSFFSLSGYDNFDPEVKHDFSVNSKIIKTLLPFDWYWNVTHFINLINPCAVLLIKYDLWYNFLYHMDKKNIYKTLINAKYRENDIKWKPVINSFYRTMYNFLNAVITADTASEKYYKQILSQRTEVVNYGDTKIEYISKAADTAKQRDIIDEKILLNKNIFIAGSTWEEDEDLIFPVIDNICSKHFENGISMLTIIVPHEPEEKNLIDIERRINSKYPNLSSIRLSNLKKYNNENVILIDGIGLLFSLYKYAALAYVGGGFRTGLHNVLEPARYGIPVLFGNVKVSEDALQLLTKGSGIAIGNSKELYRFLTDLMKEKDKRIELGLRSNSVFENRTETSKKIAELITEK